MMRLENPSNPNPSLKETKQRRLPRPETRDDWHPKTLLADFGVCLLAALLVSFSLFFFSNYNNFAPGGVTGLASILGNLLSSLEIGETTLNMSILMFAFNAPIFAMVALCVSRKTGVVLLVYLLLQTGILMLLKWLQSECGLPYYDAISEASPKENNVVFAAIGVGVVSGFGFSMMLRRFGASGGTYAISALIKRFHPEQNIAWVAFALDSSIVALAFVVYGFQINPVISTLMNIFISNLVVDYMLQGLRSGYKFEIITDSPEELSTEIMTKLGRGVTALHAQGMYTHSDKTLVVCIIRKRQIGELLKILKAQNATFSYSCKVNEVYGKFLH
ncbi:MAG: YitT family protein [Clostridia bacterium]|nr:YitT family protein [Clostridia bacterium]